MQFYTDDGSPLYAHHFVTEQDPFYPSQPGKGSVIYRKSAIKYPGGLFISSPFEGGLMETGGLFEGERDLFKFRNNDVISSN